MMTDHDDAPAAAPRLAPASETSLRVLYVEDDRLNAILFEEAARMQPGLELRVAVDADDALRQVQSWSPELLVLDAHLPDMDGFELLQVLRARPALRAVPAIMCSADTLAEDVQRAQLAGFDGFWPKPIDLHQVLGELRRRASTADAGATDGWPIIRR